VISLPSPEKRGVVQFTKQARHLLKKFLKLAETQDTDVFDLFFLFFNCT